MMTISFHIERHFILNKIIVRLSFSLVVIALIMTTLYLYRDQETLVLNEQSREALGHSYIKLDDGTVHYQFNNKALDINPSAKTIILVHGFSVPSYLFDPTFDYLVKQGFVVLRFDLFGRGFSDRPESDYSISLYVKQLHDLLAALKIKDRVNLVGLSMGGAVVTHFSNRYPEQVDKISLIAPLIHTPDRPEIAAIKIPLLGEFLAKVVIVPKLLNGLSKTVYNPDSFPDWKEKFEPQTQYKGYSKAILNTARYLAGKNFITEYEKLGKSEKAIQLIWGKQDQVIPFENSKILTSTVPSIEFHEIDQAGHLPHYEHSSKVNKLIYAFLK
jgi:pimeloyl-ACP methyl ester carboxylesterase